jgi:hypothetical protein
LRLKFKSEDSNLLLDSIGDGRSIHQEAKHTAGYQSLRLACRSEQTVYPRASCVLTIQHEIFLSSNRLFRIQTQTTISVKFKPVSSIAKYKLEWKQIELDWAAGAKSTTVSGPEGEATDLDPGMTYCVRAYCVKSDGSTGAAGPELIIDTEQVGCTPKAEKSCCVIQ